MQHLGSIELQGSQIYPSTIRLGRQSHHLEAVRASSRQTRESTNLSWSLVSHNLIQLRHCVPLVLKLWQQPLLESQHQQGVKLEHRRQISSPDHAIHISFRHFWLGDSQSASSEIQYTYLVCETQLMSIEAGRCYGTKLCRPGNGRWPRCECSLHVCWYEGTSTEEKQVVNEDDPKEECTWGCKLIEMSSRIISPAFFRDSKRKYD